MAGAAIIVGAAIVGAAIVWAAANGSGAAIVGAERDTLRVETTIVDQNQHKERKKREWKVRIIVKNDDRPQQNRVVLRVDTIVGWNAPTLRAESPSKKSNLARGNSNFGIGQL